MMEAETLHRDAALLSNKLHTFDDNDVDGVKPIIDQIREKRNQWKERRIKIAHYEKFGKLPEENVSKATGNPQKEGELRHELQLLNTAIWKLDQKIAEKPESSKVGEWSEKLAKSKLRKEEINQELIRLRYETT
ncbi:hypothetical protein VB264_16715 [Arcicella aquatica]|uniref:Uncharacterized protein n=1 Tax=Arcicella aquatica TaxID=217141 RepID=A0ABU5QRY4_9BACT|nr:hypothetical protein [Arcicella aquatica]MEA5259444.1 hypothetical protein [Arcicella aquatica]